MIQVFGRRSSEWVSSKGAEEWASLLLEFVGLLGSGVRRILSSVGSLVLEARSLALDIITGSLLNLLLSSSDVAVEKGSVFLLRFCR